MAFRIEGADMGRLPSTKHHLNKIQGFSVRQCESFSHANMTERNSGLEFIRGISSCCDKVLSL